MNKKNFLPVLLLMLFFTCLQAQADEDTVKITRTVNSFYDCLEQFDRDKLLTLLEPDIVNQIMANPGKAGCFGEMYLLFPGMKKINMQVKIAGRKVSVKSKTDKQAIVMFTALMTSSAPGAKAERKNCSDTLSLVKVNNKWLLNKYQVVRR